MQRNVLLGEMAARVRGKSFQLYKENVEINTYYYYHSQANLFNYRKVPEFAMQETFAVIYLKGKRPNLCVFLRKEANGIANSEDPDQTAPVSSLIWVCTVCPDLSVRKLRVITAKMILSFRTAMSGQTMQTQIRLSDKGLHCLLFHLHFCRNFSAVKPIC